MNFTLSSNVRIIFKYSNLYMTFQQLEWYAVDDVDFDDAEADILEIVHESGTPVLDDIELVWTSH